MVFGFYGDNLLVNFGEKDMEYKKRRNLGEAKERKEEAKNAGF